MEIIHIHLFDIQIIEHIWFHHKIDFSDSGLAIITKINNEAVRSVDQLASKLNESNSGILLEIMSESGKRDYVGFGL